MNFAKRNKSIVDFLFMLALFGAFAITALFVVLFGARIYKSTVSNMNTNYEKRTAMSYVTEKMRAHDYTGGAEVSDDNSILKLYQTVGDRNFITYMFVSDGYLKEFTADEEYAFDRKTGTNIIGVKEFSVKKEGEGLYHFNITDEDGEKTDFFVTMYSETDGEEDE